MQGKLLLNNFEQGVNYLWYDIKIEIESFQLTIR